MGLKATGCYLSRALSYRGADFALAPVPIDIVFRCVASAPGTFMYALHHLPYLRTMSAIPMC